MQPDPVARPLSRRQVLFLVSCQLAFALLFTAPIAFHLGRMELWGGNPDTYQSLWNMWWTKTAVLSGDERLFFSDWIFSPGGMPLPLHTFCPLKSFLAIPLSWVLSTVDCHNVLMLGTFVAAGLTAFLLVYDWCGRFGPALLGSFVFSYSSYHSVHALGHLNLASIEFLPLYFLCLGRLLGVQGALGGNRPRTLRGWSAGLGASWALTVLVDFQYALFLGLFTPVFWLGLRHSGRTRRISEEGSTKRSMFAIWAVVPAAVLLAPLVAGILPELLRHGLPRTPKGSEDYCLDLLAPLVPSPLNHVSGRALGPFLEHYSGWYDSYERIGYWGVLPLFLVLLALTGSSQLRVWRWILFTAWILSLGPRLKILGAETPVRLPAALFQMLPGLDQFRAPARIQVMTTLALAVLVPEGWSRLRERLPLLTRRAAEGVLWIWLAADLTAMPVITKPIRIPAVVEFLASRPGNEAVHILAKEEPTYEWMYYQTLFHKKLLIGATARTHEAHLDLGNEQLNRLREAIKRNPAGRYPEPEQVYRVFREAGVRYFLVSFQVVEGQPGVRKRYEEMSAQVFPAGPLFLDEEHAVFLIPDETEGEAR